MDEDKEWEDSFPPQGAFHFRKASGSAVATCNHLLTDVNSVPSTTGRWIWFKKNCAGRRIFRFCEWSCLTAGREAPLRRGSEITFGYEGKVENHGLGMPGTGDSWCTMP